MSTPLAAFLAFLIGFTSLAVGILVGRAIAAKWREEDKELVPVGPPIRVRRVENALLLEPVTTHDHPLVRAGKEELRGLFARAFANPAHPDPAKALAWVAEHIEDERLAVLVARRGDGPFRGLSIVTDWSDVFSPHPWVVHFFCPGDRALRIELARETARWCLARGHEKTVALNLTGYSDKRWLAAHRHISEGRIVASYGEFTIRGDL